MKSASGGSARKSIKSWSAFKMLRGVGSRNTLTIRHRWSQREAPYAGRDTRWISHKKPASILALTEQSPGEGLEIGHFVQHRKDVEARPIPRLSKAGWLRH